MAIFEKKEAKKEKEEEKKAREHAEIEKAEYPEGRSKEAK